MTNFASQHASSREPRRSHSGQRQTQQPSVRTRYAKEFHRILTSSTITKVKLGISNEVIAIAKKEILNVTMDKTFQKAKLYSRAHKLSVHENQEIHTWGAGGMVDERLHLCQSRKIPHPDDQKPHQSAGVAENSDVCKGCPER
ncbi:hypothetical protein FB451DRAFT_1173470 [Mycena latifolia]|nr:hypothetical protein FB451DRAFT_1173470 [Mycena latifolia]